MAQSHEHYDAVIIGVGQAGNPLATALSQAGRRVAVIERRYVGGTCVNDGCTPTKTMIASGRVAYLARRAADYGVQTGPVGVDLAAVRRRQLELVKKSRGGIEGRLDKLAGVTLIYGEARFDGPHSLIVTAAGGGERRLRAETIFINTGARPARPQIEGLETAGALDSTTILALEEQPEHLLVLGGGYIGLEFAQLFHRLGSRVTILHRSGQLLAREDADIAGALTDILREDGIEVLLDTTTVRAARRKTGEIVLAVQDGAREREVTGSHLLVATGRTPNTERLNLAAGGLQADDKGYIPVNERLETNVPGVYALGDVRGGPAFTHVAYDDYRIVCTNLLAGGGRTTRDALVPYTIFTDPELGRVGLSEKAAQKQGRAVRVARLPMDHVARANEMDEARGLLKALVDPATGQILGCAALGIGGGEIMSMVQLAMLGNLPYTALRDGMFAHPTLAEGLNTLFESLE
jgi:pyruvate/2-oxoglutarate dehydrogenase complex dihydrolipoamide dehydrogenase (E3) component